MPLNTHCSGYELAGRVKWNLALQRFLPDPPIFEEGEAASTGVEPHPNILKGFIPPQEFTARSML